MTKRAALRASDADREQVAERLRHAAAEGRLLADELGDRLGAALSAKTYGELDAVLSDLPTPEVGRRTRSLAPVGPQMAAAAAVALAVAVVLMAAIAVAITGHTHPGHHWGNGVGGGGGLIWLLLLAVGWRFLSHRQHGSK
jgi:Domain of unknown function (DUF1707)